MFRKLSPEFIDHSQCRRRGSNPHSGYPKADFTSAASTNSATGASRKEVGSASFRRNPDPTSESLEPPFQAQTGISLFGDASGSRRSVRDSHFAYEWFRLFRKMEKSEADPRSWRKCHGEALDTDINTRRGGLEHTENLAKTTKTMIIKRFSYSIEGSPFLIVLFAMIGLSAAVSHGSLIYTWTGAAGDGNWSNDSNWDGNGVPVDSHVDTGNAAANGLNLDHENSIRFTGTNMPTTGFPDPVDPVNNPVTTDSFLSVGGRNGGGGSRDTPRMIFNSGGAIGLTTVGLNKGLVTEQNPSTVFTIGDGIGGGTENVTVNLTFGDGGDLMRHSGGRTNNFLVNSDGTWNVSNLDDFSSGTDRFATITIDGGTVNFDTDLDDLKAEAGNFIDFTSVGGSFTFAKGNEFNSLSDVTDSFGTDFLSSGGATLTAFDNGTSFTVFAAVPEPSTFTALLLGAMGLLFRRKLRKM